MVKKNVKTGDFVGVPYDWSKPNKKRFESRTWNPNAPIITKRWYGWGYDFNFYALVHPLKWHKARSKGNK